MEYYNRSAGKTLPLPFFATPETCRDYGYWPIYYAPFNYDLHYYTRSLGPVVFNEDSDTYTQEWEPVLLPLNDIKYWKRKEFSDTFTHLEARASRPTSSLALRLVDGETTFPDDDFDAGLLWSIEQVKQANRDLLAGLEAMTIPEDATVEEEKAILEQALAVVPWLPEAYTYYLLT